MSRVATFVFMDLEATGFPEQENNQTRITELSMVAVKREHLLTATKGTTPRIQHKLTICLNPRTRLVGAEAATITGLTNELLKTEPTFDDNVFNLISCFFKVLTKPICLIAHDGLSADFPILKNHLEQLNKSFADISCADSFHGFYYVLETRKGKVLKTPTGRMMYRRFVSRSPIPRYPWGMGPKQTDSYQLKAIYERVLKKTAVDAHRAEADSIFTLEISAAIADDFVAWVDKNQVPFEEIIPMKIGVPLFKPPITMR